MKYYAVKKGRTPGVYRTWEDAKNKLMAFPVRSISLLKR